MVSASSSYGSLPRATVYTRAALRARLFNTLLWVQGTYYFVTGLWPILSIESFQRVTGPKTDHLPTGRESDHWLVLTVGTLIVAIAVTLLFAALRKRKVAEVALLAVLSALGLTTIDVVYAARGVISSIYLLDAVAEIMLIGFWLFVLAHVENEPSGTLSAASQSEGS